jgi:hypothetical protein
VACGGVAAAAKFVVHDFLGDMAGLLSFLSMAVGVFFALIGIARLIDLF